MLAPAHDILGARSPDAAARRTAIIGGVAMLHVAIVYAILTGMAAHVVKIASNEIEVTFVDHKPATATPVPPKPVFQKPTQTTTPTVPQPVIAIASDRAPQFRAQPGPDVPSNAVPDSMASGIGNTHTIPPYPDLARLLGHQGTVLLQLTVSPQGDVVSAVVLSSTGYPELDSAAVDWVDAHWKYKPAIQGGQPVTSQVQVSIKFDLRQAAR